MMRPLLRPAMIVAAQKIMMAALPLFIGSSLYLGWPGVAKAQVSPDGKTETIAKKTDGSVGVPTPAADPKPGIYKYDATIAAGGKQMAMGLQTEIKDAGANLIFIDTVSLPGNDATDTATVAKGTLLIKSRVVKQDTVNVETTYDGPKVTGKVTVNGTERPIDSDIGGPAFAEAAGAPFVIASLPLHEGYTTTFRNFDLQRQKVKIEGLHVTGSETVTVPAGTFDSFKVEVTNTEDNSEKVTYWVAKSNRSVVKIEATVPTMGGATMKAELL